METIAVIHNWNDLEAYGIDMLTGEACGYSMRLLCDLTKEGMELMTKFLGGTVRCEVGSNWNFGTDTRPHVASVLLPREVFPALAAFVLLETYPNAWVISSYDSFFAIKGPPDPNLETFYNDIRYYRRPNEVTRERNTHAMSGRTI